LCPVYYDGFSGGGGSSTTEKTISTGDFPISLTWAKPYFIRHISVSSSGKNYRVDLYVFRGKDAVKIDSKVMEGNVVSWHFSRGLFSPNGLKVVVIQAEAGEKINLFWDGVPT